MPSSATLAATATVAVAVAGALWWRRRRSARAAKRIIARYPSRVAGRPWYREIVVTEQQATDAFESVHAMPLGSGAGAGAEPLGSEDVVRALHLGSGDNEPESRVLLRHGRIVPQSGLVLKPHLQYSLLAFAWLEGGFAADARAALVGVAGGALLHFWRECVPGGAALAVDAVELDGAVLQAAREHMDLEACEPARGGRVEFNVADGADWLRDAEDEAYDLLVVDLDMGALVAAADRAAAAAEAAAASEGGGGDGSADAERRRRARTRKAKAADPARDMYRVLSSRGVLVLNEYSEEPVASRLESSLRTVRALRRYFPEVHIVRTTTHHNVMIIAPVERGAGCDSKDELAARAAKCDAALGLGGIGLGALVAALPANRHQVYA